MAAVLIAKLRILLTQIERFARGVSSRQYGGLGLGLYIIAQIVEATG